MTQSAHETGVSVGAWNALVRRARIGRDRKAAALIISSYANSDGTGIHCGVARLSADLEASYRTTQRYLAWLREVGLIELVREGNRRRHRSDEYRLTLGPDILEHLEVLDPDRYDEMCGGIRVARKASSVRDQASPMVAPDGPVDNSRSGATLDGARSGAAETDQASTMVTPDEVDQASNQARSGATLGGAPPSMNTFPRRSTSPTTAEEDLRTAVTVAREPPEPNPVSSRCPHGLTGAARTDGRPACALCRIAEDRPGTALPPPLPPEHLADVIDIRTWEAS